MDTISAIIVDDESRARRVLGNLLDKDPQNITVLATCNNIISAVTKIKELKPDVVFLDVQMPHHPGYELVNFFKTIDFEIVFVTAFDNYVMKAFELCAIDYLVKPIHRERLHQALQKLHSRLEEKDRLNKYETLLNTIKSNEFTQIVIPELGNRRVLNLKELIAIEADGAYSKLHLMQGKSIYASKNLKYFQDVLPENSYFFRSHRGWIVNLSYVKTMNRTKGILHLQNDLKAKLSRSRYSEFELAIG